MILVKRFFNSIKWFSEYMLRCRCTNSNASMTKNILGRINQKVFWSSRCCFHPLTFRFKPQKRFLLPRRIAERFISDQSGYAYYAVIAIHINVLAPLPSNAVILHRPFCLFLTYSRSRSFYPSSLNHLAKYPEAQC